MPSRSKAIKRLLKEKIVIRKKNRQMHRWGRQAKYSYFDERLNSIITTIKYFSADEEYWTFLLNHFEVFKEILHCLFSIRHDIWVVRLHWYFI